MLYDYEQNAIFIKNTRTNSITSSPDGKLVVRLYPGDIMIRENTAEAQEQMGHGVICDGTDQITVRISDTKVSLP